MPTTHAQEDTMTTTTTRPHAARIHANARLARMARGAWVQDERVILLLEDGTGPKDAHDVLEYLTGTRAWTITGLRQGYATYRPER